MHMFSDYKISDLLIQLINNYYLDNNHKINLFSADELLCDNKISDYELRECINYIDSQVWKLNSDNYSVKLFTDVPSISMLNINYNSYRTILFVAQQYNSAIIFRTSSKSVFNKSNSDILHHLSKLLSIYKSISSFNSRLINIIEPDFNFSDFKLFIRLSIFLCALHLKL